MPVVHAPVLDHTDKHLCHAPDCKTEVPPKMFMCLKHWKMVPKEQQKKIWEFYVPGQEIRKDPSAHYLYWAAKARITVAQKERKLIHPESLRKLEEFRVKLYGDDNPKTEAVDPFGRPIDPQQ